MSRKFANITASFSVLAVGLFCGCQKQMGNAANGPFSPAGTLSPATSQPLIPFGPIGGATRVPPPPTGSAQANNGYLGPNAASASVPNGGAVAYDSFASSTTPPGGSGPVDNPHAAQQLSANSRSTLGGMPVIDLTAGMNTAQNRAFPHANEAVGSGIASVPAGINQMANGGSQGDGQPGNWQPGFVQPGAVQQTQSISVPPGDLASRLRPLDANVSAGATPVQGQPNVAMTQYRSETQAPSPAWQAVQPVAAIVESPQYVSQLPTGPSTEPVNQPGITGSGQNQNPNNSLLWRNPSAAR